MINLDDALAGEFLAGALATMETDLLAIEKAGAEIDEDRVNRVIRSLHSIKGESGFFDLPKVRELAHKIEDVLGLIRSRKVVPTSDLMQVLFRALDQLDELIRNAASAVVRGGIGGAAAGRRTTVMPEMDGREAVRRVRASEEEHHISSIHGSKIIMTTAVDDIKEVSGCFQELCDDYLVKPVDLTALLIKMT